MKLGWKTFAITDAMIEAHLEEVAQQSVRANVMIDNNSRRSRRHLKLHRDGKGWFVRAGNKGGSKEYLGQCKVTYFDGVPGLFAFTFASVDAFEAEQERLLMAKYGVPA